MRAVGASLLGAIIALAVGWWFEWTVLANFSALVRIFLSASFCASIYLLIVLGLFRNTEPISIVGRLVHDFRASAAQR
jgi:hypothetical protein